MKLIQVLLLCLVAIVLSGCLQCYVDPTVTKSSYTDVVLIEKPITVNLESKFSFNGKHQEQTTPILHEKILKAFEKTGVIEISRVPTDYSLTVSVNDTGDMGAAFGKGFLTGLTFGLIGCSVDDNYAITISYKSGDDEAISKNYQHRLSSTIGLIHPIPYPNTKPTKTPFDEIMDDTALKFILDMQKEGYWQKN